MKKSMLLSTIAMIVVVVVALSTATFAWFTTQQQSAISGTATIEATKDFIIKEYIGGETKWQVTDSLSLSADTIKPVAPQVALSTEPQIKKGDSAGVDDDPVQATKELWYNVDSAWNSFTGYTLTKLMESDKAVATVKPFQLSMGDYENGGTATVTIKVATAGLNLADLQAIRAMNVVLRVESYKDNSVQWIGTQYNVQSDNSVVYKEAPDADKLQKAQTPGKGFTAVKETYTVQPGSTQKDALQADGTANLATITSASSGREYKGTVGSITDGLVSEITDTIVFGAQETFLVTAYVWLDGYQAADAIMSKGVVINVGFAKNA